MTTNPAMPEHTIGKHDHPEPHTMRWSDLELAAIKRYAESYALATLQAQPAEVSDAEIDAVTLEQWGPDAIRAAHRQYARAILALRPQAVPMTPEPKAAPKLIGWRTENFLWETDDVDKARNWEPNIGVLPIFEDDPNTKLRSRGITAPAGGEG